MLEIGNGKEKEDAKRFAEAFVLLRDEVEKCSRQMDDWEEYFGAVALGLAKYRFYTATSGHQLVIRIGSGHVHELLGVVGMVREDDYEDENSEHLESVYRSFDVEDIVSALDDAKLRMALAYPPPLGKRATLRFLMRLQQEVFRVWKRFYPEDGYPTADDEKLRPLVSVMFGYPATSGNRAAYARDHLWLKWKLREGLTPAKIRNRWNRMNDSERRRICPLWHERIGGTDSEGKKAGIEVVKTGLKKAKRELEEG